MYYIKKEYRVSIKVEPLQLPGVIDLVLMVMSVSSEGTKFKNFLEESTIQWSQEQANADPWWALV